MSDDKFRIEFLAYFARHHRRIYGYIRSQVRCANDADDLLQETSVILWQKFDQFDRSKDFTRWGCGIARNIMLHHFRDAGRHRALFSEPVDQLFVDEVVRSLEKEDESADALAECLKQLPRQQHDLIEMRYAAERSVAEMARLIDRSESAVYKSLAKVHEILFDCIQAKLARGRTS